MTIEETKDLETMTIEQLQGRLQGYEENHKKKQWIEEQLLNMEVSPKKKEESFDNEKGNMSEVEAKNEEEITVMEEVGILTTLIMKKEKAQLEDEEEATQDQGMTNTKQNAIIVINFGIML